MLSKFALLVAVVALGVAAFAVVDHRSTSGERHRCGFEGQGGFTCISNDTPPRAKQRNCSPLGRQQGVMFWQCNRVKR
jgi:hypothetical protein